MEKIRINSGTKLTQLEIQIDQLLSENYQLFSNQPTPEM